MHTTNAETGKQIILVFSLCESIPLFSYPGPALSRLFRQGIQVGKIPHAGNSTAYSMTELYDIAKQKGSVLSLLQSDFFNEPFIVRVLEGYNCEEIESCLTPFLEQPDKKTLIALIAKDFIVLYQCGKPLPPQSQNFQASYAGMAAVPGGTRQTHPQWERITLENTHPHCSAVFAKSCRELVFSGYCPFHKKQPASSLCSCPKKSPAQNFEHISLQLNAIKEINKAIMQLVKPGSSHRENPEVSRF